MSTFDHINEENREELPLGKGLKIGIIVSDWNKKITHSLMHGAIDALKKCEVSESDIDIKHVPGSFELIYAAKKMSNEKEYDAIIVLGSVVRGGTPHFDYVCQGVTQGIAQLNAEGSIPFIFGLLTTDDMEQAEDRAGGKLGNKGAECAITAVSMARF